MMHIPNREAMLEHWREVRVRQDATPQEWEAARCELLEVAEAQDWEDWKRYLDAHENYGIVPDSEALPRFADFLHWARNTEKRVEPWLVAQALFNAYNISSGAQDNSAASGYLAELRALASSHEDEPGLRVELAKALVNAFHYASQAGHEDAADTVLAELRTLASRHEDEPGLREWLAKALVNAVGLSEEPERIGAHLVELRALASSHEDEPGLRDLLARALFNAFHDASQAGHEDAADTVLAELRALASSHEDEPGLRVELAKALVNAVGLSEEPERIGAHLVELRALASSHEDEPGLRDLLARALFNAFHDASQAGHEDAADTVLAELRTLASSHEDEPGLRVELARALVNTVGLSEEPERIDAHLVELRTLASSHEDEPGLREWLGKALWNTSISHNNAGRRKQAHDTLTELLQVIKGCPEESVGRLRAEASRFQGIIKEQLGVPQVYDELIADGLCLGADASTALSARDALRNKLERVIREFRPEKKRILKTMKFREARVKNFLRDESLFRSDASVLMILRQWNSFTPIIVDGQESDRGGGYFIFHRGTGLVIDPGYNFIELFYQAGGRIHDITHIAATHAHDDHTAQLEQLFTMLHKYNSDREFSKRKRVTLLLNHSTIKKFSGFDMYRDCGYIKQVICLNAFHENNPQTLRLDSANELSLTVLPAYHDDVFSMDYAVGLGLRIQREGSERSIVFTGDTSLFPPKIGKDGKVEEYTILPYKGIKKVCEDQPERSIHMRYPDEFRQSPDLLVPHLGSIKEYEFDPQVPKGIYKTSQTGTRHGTVEQTEHTPESPMFYPNHLGLLGTATLIQEMSPKAVILSEFGSELRDFRMLVAKLLEKALQGACRTTDEKQALPFIIPGDCTIVYSIKDGKFLCHEDCMFHDNEMLKAEEVSSGQGNLVGIFKKEGFLKSLEHYFNSLKRLRDDKSEEDHDIRLPYMR